MRPQSRDTDPAAERVQVELLQRATLAKRSARMRSLTRTSFRLAVRALRRRHPELSEDELLVLFAELNDGSEIAAGLRRDLERRGRLA